MKPTLTVHAGGFILASEVKAWIDAAHQQALSRVPGMRRLIMEGKRSKDQAAPWYRRLWS